MPLEILAEVRQIDGDRAAKAFAEVTLQTEHGELTLSRLRVIHQDDKEPWVAYPDIRYQDNSSGEYRNLKTIQPGARLRKAISEAVLTKYAELGVGSK